MTRTQRSYKRAVLWAQAMTWTDRGFSAIFAIVLAALLGPEAFGLMAIALAFVLFLQMLVEQGLPSAIIQRPELEDDHLHATFWLTTGLSLAMCALSVALAGWWGSLNDSRQITGILQVLALMLPISGLSIVQQAMLQREMDFRTLAILTGASVLAGGAVGIGGAIAGWGVWALVAQHLTRASGALVLLWSLGSYRPALRFSRRHLGEITRFSGAVFLNSIGAYVNRQAYIVVIGLFFSPVAAGLYAVATRIRDLARLMALRPLALVALPEFSRYQDDPAMLRRRFRRMLSIAAALLFPPLAALVALTRPIVDLLGDRWAEYAPAMAATLGLLAMHIVSAPLAIFCSSALIATGKPLRAAQVDWSSTILTIIAYLIAGVSLAGEPVSRQVVGFAAIHLLFNAIVLPPIQLYFVHRATGMGPGPVLRTAAPMALASTLAGLAGWGVLQAPAISATPAPVRLGAGALVFGAVLAPLAFALDSSLKSTIADLRQRLFPRAAPATGAAPAEAPDGAP